VLINYPMAYEKKKGNWTDRGSKTGDDEQNTYSSGCPLLDSELQSSQANIEMSNGRTL